jgi:hypothetical protein
VVRDCDYSSFKYKRMDVQRLPPVLLLVLYLVSRYSGPCTKQASASEDPGGA